MAYELPVGVARLRRFAGSYGCLDGRNVAKLEGCLAGALIALVCLVRKCAAAVFPGPILSSYQHQQPGPGFGIAISHPPGVFPVDIATAISIYWQGANGYLLINCSCAINLGPIAKTSNKKETKPTSSATGRRLGARLGLSGETIPPFGSTSVMFLVLPEALGK